MKRARSGKPATKPISSGRKRRKADMRAVAKGFQKLREGIGRRIGGFSIHEIREMIETGRRF